MKNLDVFIVRVLPFVLFIQVGISILNCWRGVDLSDFYLLHSNSAIYSASLYFISLSNKKYHCIWNRAMYVLLITIPTFNYLDAKLLNIDTYSYLYAVTIFYFIIAIITANLAISHFIKVRKLRRK
jgi:hypothetical protein